MRSVWIVACFMLFCCLSACGGGGGDGANGQGGVTLSRTTLNFQSQQHSSVRPAPQTITATARTGNVYLGLAGYSFAGIDCPGTSTCTITVNAPVISPPPQPGSYTYTLTVRICSDAFCQSVIRTEAVTITHTVTAGVQLTTTPAAVSLVADQGQTASQSLTLAFANGMPTTVSAVVSYPPGNGAGWLTVTPRINSLVVSATSLAAESYQAFIALTYAGANFSNTVDIPVTYTVRSLPSVEYVVPHIAIENEPRTVVIRGKGFDRMTHPVRFGGIDAQNVTVVSDTELRATPPAFSSAGSYAVDVPNDNSTMTGTAQYVVVAPQHYAAAQVDISNAASSGLLEKQVIYDAKRQSVYFTKDPFEPSRARFVAGSWVVAPLPGASGRGLGRMSPSPDGHKLYFASDTTATEYDLDLGEVSNTYSEVASGPVEEIVILNDGKGLTYGQFSATLFDFALHRSTQIPFLGLYPHYAVTSGDLSRAILLQDGGDSDAFSFDASRREFTNLGAVTGVGTYQIALNRHATRIVMGSRVYDGSYTLLGSLSGWDGTSGVAISPDGNRAYVVAHQSYPNHHTTLKVFDIGATAGPYAQIGATITLTPFSGYAPGIAVSPDGLTLFIVGNERFFVVPVP